jgi:hypothetical protein
VEYILTFSPTYYKENYKNKKGVFYKQIEESRKTAISNLYVPIKHRCLKERFSGDRTYFWERFLGGKYILYTQYSPPHVEWDTDDDDYEEDPERVYFTGFCRASNYSHIGYGIHRMEEHRFDLSKIVYSEQ